MNNLLSYCGLVDAKISDSDKNLPMLVKILVNFIAVNTLWGLNRHGINGVPIYVSENCGKLISKC